MGKQHKSEKRARNVVSSDDEDIPDNKNQKIDNKDGESDELFDEEERKKLSLMSEKDRETEIFKRIEMNQILKTREEIKKKLEMTQKSDDKKLKSTLETSNREQRLSRSRKSKKLENAIESCSDSSSETSSTADEDDELMSSSLSSDTDNSEEEEKKLTLKKKDVKKHTKKSKSFEENDEFDEKDFDTEYHQPSDLANKQSKKKAMNILLSKRRDKKDAEEKRKQNEKTKAKYDIDEIFGNNDSKSDVSSSSSSTQSPDPESPHANSTEVKLEIKSIADLSRIRISRFRLSQFIHAPFFNKLAIGSFVRIGIGNSPDGKAVYRVAQIADVVETSKVYQIEKTKTNKGIRLKHGADEKVYRLEFVSNGEFTLNEYHHWLKAMQSKDIPLPTMDFIERKEKEIKMYSNHSYTNSDIDYIVKEKSKFSHSPSNFAVQKGEFLKAKELAEQSGDFQQVQNLQNKIDELDNRADFLDRQRSKKLSVVTWINQRNRDLMKQSFLGNNVTKDEIKLEDDPFTRKSGKMRMVSGKPKRNLSLNQPKTSTSSQLSGGESYASSLSCSQDDLIQKTISTTSSPVKKNNSKLSKEDDLFNIHNIDIDIQIKLPEFSGSSSRSSPNVSTQKKQTNTARSLTLEEYKRKRGLL